jgi:hypothetical protein
MDVAIKLYYEDSSKWEIQVNIQTASIHGQGDGSNLKGSYLCFHKTFVCLQPSFWSRVPETNSSPLWYELGLENVYWEATNVNFHIGDEWTKGILVETLKLIQCVVGSSKISKTWIFISNFW